MAAGIPLVPTHPTDPIFERNKRWAVPGPWITQLPADQEQQFLQWAEKNRNQLSMQEMLAPNYDMRGFWKALMAGDPRARSGVNEVDKLVHYPDIWKTPYHESFNKQSMYSLPTNPYHWVGDMQDPALVGINRQVIIPRKSGKPVDWDYRGPQ